MFKVLLVDDEQIERMALTRKIEKYYGDRVLCSQAVDGRDAIKVFQQEEQDVVIMDISMPEMNGVMAARRIREMSSDCSIIFLSAYDDFNYTRNAIKVKALDYLLKPCDKNDLLAVMDMALHLAEVRQSSLNEASRHYDSHKLQENMLAENGTQDNLLQNMPQNMPQNMQQNMPQNMPQNLSQNLSQNMQTSLSQELQENELGAGATRKEINELAVAQRMKQYVIDNYSRDISMQEAARTMEYSDAYFSKLFKQYFNQNFTAYLTEYRIREAKRLLAETNISIKEISRMVGYFDANYFAKIFKRMEGVIPSKYREEV